MTSTSVGSAADGVGVVQLQHVEDAASLWGRREGAVQDPHFNLADLKRLDGRLDAHLDGIRTAGRSAWLGLTDALVAGEAEDLFLAAHGSLLFDDEVGFDRSVNVCEGEPAKRYAVVSALSWLGVEQSRSIVDRLHAGQSHVGRAIALEVGIAEHTGADGALAEALGDTHDLVLETALRGIGVSGRVDLLPRINGFLTSANRPLQLATAWAVGLRSGDAGALKVLTEAARSMEWDAFQAMSVLVRRLDVKNALHLLGALGESGAIRLQIQGTGMLGVPDCIPWLISMMSEPNHARVAGEAFTMITGAGLAFRDLEGEPPENVSSMPNDDPRDEDVGIDPDENLPWPHPGLVERWWSRNQGRFDRASRHLVGLPITEDWLRTVLRDGYQRQRAAAALELGIRNTASPLFDVRAPADRQVGRLGRPGTPIR